MPEQASWGELRWNEQGLIPTIVQDAGTGDVLMMAWMNAASLLKTLETGQTHFWSRSRKELWHKGDTSGNIQRVLQRLRRLRRRHAARAGGAGRTRLPHGARDLLLSGVRSRKRAG